MYMHFRTEPLEKRKTKEAEK